MGDYARKSVNLQIALLKEVNLWVQLPKVRNLKIVLSNNLPWIANQEIVFPKGTNLSRKKVRLAEQSKQFGSIDRY